MEAQIFTRNFINYSPSFNTKDVPIGGAEVYLENLASLLSKLGFEVEIFQLGNKYDINNYLNFKIVTLNLGYLKSKLFPIFLPKIFYNLEEEESLKIYNYPNLAIARKNRKPSIGIFHGVDWDTSFFNYVSRELKYREGGLRGIIIAIVKYFYFTKINPLLVYRGISKLDVTVSVDSNIKKFLPENLSSKVKVVYNFVDCNKFKPDFSKTKNNYEKVKILVPRNLNVARGVYILPYVCRILLRKTKNFEFIVTGSGPLKNYLTRTIEQYGLDNYFNLMGHVDHNVMPDVYLKSDIVLIPSVFSEGTTLAALEAMACGKPLIATEVGGLKEIGEDGINKIVVNFDASSIASKILFLIDNQDFAEELGKKARDYVCKNFSKEVWERKWTEIIKEVI